MYSTVYSKADCGTCRPSVNVQENVNAYKLEVALPGYNKEDINIKVDGTDLIISSELEAGKSEKYLRKEFASGKFKRTFILPADVVSENISAEYNNGILILSLPKKEKVEIKIQDVNIAN